MSSSSTQQAREEAMRQIVQAFTNDSNQSYTTVTTTGTTQTDSTQTGFYTTGDPPDYYQYNAPGTITWPAPLKEIECPLPKDVLERMLVKGMANSKNVLKQKVKEAFEKWCETGKLDVSVFPVLLAAAMVSLDLHKEMRQDEPAEEVKESK